MLTLYLFALLVGGGLLAFSLLGGDDGANAHHDALSGDNPLQFLSLRTLTYFLFVFGGVRHGANGQGSEQRCPSILVHLLPLSHCAKRAFVANATSTREAAQADARSWPFLSLSQP